MWIPKDEQDIITAAASGGLEESVTFDAKREIPAKNSDTAKDVAALANTAGGVLLYGVDEDTSGRPTVLTPITLAGQRERIEQIIRTSIDEVPNFSLSAIQTSNAPLTGYLILLVPPSERAPHMS
jgi:predicted HTH transcriptional regulator